MIAAFENQGWLHIVRSVARKGFKAQSIGYCNVEGNAADGTLQVPEWVFDGKSAMPAMFGAVRACPNCGRIAKELREPPPAAT